jgi:hypothetical protein
MSITDITDTDLFSKVRDHINDAHLIAWDGCHKIYLALDEVEADWLRENYEHIVEESPEFMLVMLGEWWDESCPLRFISGVRHNEADPNAGFVTLIEQFEDSDDEDDAS